MKTASIFSYTKSMVKEDLTWNNIKSYWPLIILMGTFLWGYSSLTTKVDYLIESNKAIVATLSANETRLTRLETQLNSHVNQPK